MLPYLQTAVPPVLVLLVLALQGVAVQGVISYAPVSGYTANVTSNVLYVVVEYPQWTGYFHNTLTLPAGASSYSLCTEVAHNCSRLACVGIPDPDLNMMWYPGSDVMFTISPSNSSSTDIFYVNHYPNATGVMQLWNTWEVYMGIPGNCSTGPPLCCGGDGYTPRYQAAIQTDPLPVSCYVPDYTQPSTFTLAVNTYQAGAVNQTMWFSPWAANSSMGVPANTAMTRFSRAPLLGVSEELRTSTATCCSGSSYGRWCQDTNNTTPAGDKGFTIPSLYFLPTQIGKANNLGLTYNNWAACFTAINANLQPYGCPGYDHCTKLTTYVPYRNCSSPGINDNDQFFYWRRWGSTGENMCAPGDVGYLGSNGPYPNSNDTQGAWVGSALNATCTWLGLNQNVTINGQATYQRGFQCVYGMQARWAPQVPRLQVSLTLDVTKLDLRSGAVPDANSFLPQAGSASWAPGTASGSVTMQLLNSGNLTSANITVSPAPGCCGWQSGACSAALLSTTAQTPAGKLTCAPGATVSTQFNLSLPGGAVSSALAVTCTFGFKVGYETGQPVVMNFTISGLTSQVAFGLASSTFAADTFVNAVLFAPNIAAQLFASDVAFQAAVGAVSISGTATALVYPPPPLAAAPPPPPAACPVMPDCGGHGAVTAACGCVCDAGWQTAADQQALAAGGSASAVFCLQAFSATTPAAALVYTGARAPPPPPPPRKGSLPGAPLFSLAWYLFVGKARQLFGEDDPSDDPAAASDATRLDAALAASGGSRRALAVALDAQTSGNGPEGPRKRRKKRRDVHEGRPDAFGAAELPAEDTPEARLHTVLDSSQAPSPAELQVLLADLTASGARLAPEHLRALQQLESAANGHRAHKGVGRRAEPEAAGDTGQAVYVIRRLAAAGTVPSVAEMQALVAGIAASGERLRSEDRAALAELVQRAAAARGVALPRAEQLRPPEAEHQRRKGTPRGED
ncbi:hypothetical protein WJX81_007128 [Elliptochloris bilobata]|uniref:Uncharacterized protein n=1 Tax=Elliptochloris bilobata TaxID=381761 RepID=A0AAW1REP0_9CHLO